MKTKAMNPLSTKFPTETWASASWEEYLQATEEPGYENAKFYYNNGQLRIEMTPLGHDHASDNAIISLAVHLFCIVKGIPQNTLLNCTYRKPPLKEAQPDVSYYIGQNAQAIPFGTKVIDLDRYPPPELVIEIADSSLADDKGEKRLLYEELQVKEYWIVDVKNIQIIAFAVKDKGSWRIRESGVLPDLAISLLEEALRRTRQMPQNEVGAWLIQQFQQ